MNGPEKWRVEQKSSSSKTDEVESSNSYEIDATEAGNSKKSAVRRRKSSTSPRKRPSSASGPNSHFGNLQIPIFPFNDDNGIDVDKLLDLESKEVRGWNDEVLCALNNFPILSQQQRNDEVEFQLNISNLELNPTFKRRKQDSDDEEEIIDGSRKKAVPSPAEGEATFAKPKPRCRKFIFKPFKRLEDGSLVHDESKEPVDVTIPEQLAASYGLYIWPCSPVLAWYIWLHQAEFADKTVLELGSGTCLPGLLCAKIGSKQVLLSDDFWQPNTLKNCKEAVKVNGLSNSERVKVLGVSWGEYSNEILRFKDLDFLIGSDLLFDPKVFEPLVKTIALLLERNERLKVLVAVQERSSDWSIEEQLKKWNLICDYVYPREFLKGTGIDESDIIGGHTIFILRVFRK